MADGVPSRLRSRLDPTERYSLRVVLVAVAIVLVAIPFATLLFQVVAEGPLTRVDGDVADALNGYVHERTLLLTGLKAVTFLGSTVWLTAVTAVAAVGVLRAGRSRLCVFLVVTCLGGAVVNYSVKLAVSRPRPVVDHVVAEASGKSFPSGHAMSSTVVYGSLLLVFLPVIGRRYRPIVLAGTVILLAAIGFSRLALGVHYITDVLGGYVLGAAWLALSVAAFSIWRVERGRPPVEIEEGLEPEAADGLV